MPIETKKYTMFKNVITLILIFIASGFCYSQSAEPNDFSDVKNDYSTVKALKTRIQELLDKGADQIVIDSRAHEVEMLKWELEELEIALKHSTNSIFHFISESYKRISSDLDQEGAIDFFNKTYGDENIPYIFEGYVVKRDDGYTYVYVVDPLITTYWMDRPKRVRRFDDLTSRGQHFGIESKAKMVNDTTLDDGFVYIRTTSSKYLSPRTAKSDIAESMGRKKSELSENRIDTYRDTNTYYQGQIQIKKKEIDRVGKEITSLQKNLNEINRQVRYLGSFPERVEEVRLELEALLATSIDSSSVEDLQKNISKITLNINRDVSDREAITKELLVEIDQLKSDAILEANDDAKVFFEESWEPYRVVIDSRIQMREDWRDGVRVPYIFLTDWSIRKKEK